MARAGQTTVEFNQAFFDDILRSSGVERLTQAAAEKTASTARATAPVDSGAYRDGIRVLVRESKYRRVYRVTGTDPKTMLIESKTGNLARALKATKT